MKNITRSDLLVMIEFIVIIVLLFIYSEKYNAVEKLEFELKNTQSIYEDYTEKLNVLQMDYDDLQKEYSRSQEALDRTRKEYLRLRKKN